MQAYCPRCGLIRLTVGQPIGAKLTCSALGAAVGSQVLKNPLAVVMCTLAGLAVGSYIDREFEKRCPQCGAILRAVGPLLY